MKRTRTILSVLALTILFSSVPVIATPKVALAACTGWTFDAYIGDWYCEPNDGCGFLWAKGTNTKKTRYIRYCDIDGKQVKETKYGPTKDGCCV